MKVAETCVVLCAGKATRLVPPLPKPLTRIGGVPLVARVAELWHEQVDRFVFVVGHAQKDVRRLVRTLPIDYSFVEQVKPRGIADALMLCNRRASHLGERFVVALGDCLQDGTMIFPVGFDIAVGVWTPLGAGAATTDEICAGYSVAVDHGLVARVVEKPERPLNGNCGMGTYIFTHSIFDCIERTPRSARHGEVEITDAIQVAIDSGLVVKPIWLYGQYINITYPHDIERAEKRLGYAEHAQEEAQAATRG